MPRREPELFESRPPSRPDGHWRIELLGGLRARSGDWVIGHFPGRPVSALLARLALAPRRSHAREELIELLWPGVELEVGRNRLRQVLSTLRTLLEPPGSGAGAVLIADRQTVRFHPDAVDCDALEFERAFRERRDADARALYRGELLPGFFDDWVVEERRRLEALHDQLVAREDAPPVRPPGVAVAVQAPGLARLPTYLSSFVGREAELASCLEAVAAERLVTLSGPGGCGKTRLSTEVARRIGGFEPVLFVGLADCRDGPELAGRVRAAARLSTGSNAPLEALAAELGERRALLVLDNFEQLVASGGADALLELLAALPQAHALVTSRRVLRLQGETEVSLAPLALPTVDDDLVQAARNPAVALFIDRARSVRADFRLTARNREDLLEICRMLEGLPLALEIAATRVRTYSLAEMRVELVRRFPVLTRSGPQAARDPRHASLHAAIDWSWQLLAPPTRDFLGGLTVFRGGWTAADARAVTEAADAHDLLDGLIADSLLTVEADTESGDEGGHRFQMLEAVREFVLAQVDPRRVAAWRQAHRAHCLSAAIGLAARHQPVGEGALVNFIEALRTALADGEEALALALFLALKLRWESVGTPPEALALMRRAAQVVSPGTDRLALFLSMLARLLIVAGHSAEALACATRALDEAGNDPAARAEAMFAHTRVEWVWKRDGARVIGPAREGLRLARAAGTREVEAAALSLVGAVTLWGLGRPAEALPIYEEAEALYLGLGNPRGALQATHGRMGCLYSTGRFEEAARMGEGLGRQAEAVGNVEAQLVALNLLTACQSRLGLFADALATGQSEARLALRHHKVYNLVNALWGQGHCLARLRRPEEAAVLMAFSERYWVDHLGPLPTGEQRHREKVRRLVRLQLGALLADAAWARGQALGEREGVRLGTGEG